MNPLEFRKILIVGYSFDAPEGAPVLDRDGLPLRPVQCPIKMRVVFWIPARAPFQRREGTTLVSDARPFELQALKDGAIVEQVQDFTFDRQPTAVELRDRLMPYWERRAVESLGVLPNAPPEDHDQKPRVTFEAI